MRSDYGDLDDRIADIDYFMTARLDHRLRQITALILIGTLSRVIASCCSTEVVIVRISIVTCHSMSGSA